MVHDETVSTTTERLPIRVAGEADAGALADVAAVTFALACPPSTTQKAIADFISTKLSADAFADALDDPARLVVVLDLPDGRLGGYTLLVFGEPGDADVAAAIRFRPTVELSKCYARPELHGTGASALLLARSMDEARDRGAAGMWLGTNEENARAIRFYGKHGFERVGTKRFRLGDRDEHDFVFERALD